MCLQCITHATITAKDVLPGFTLMQSTEHHEDWPKGWYGLVESNDPSIVFEGPLLIDPVKGMEPDDLDWMPEMPEGYDEYDEGAKKLTEALKVDANLGHRLVEACRQEGYDPQDHGSVAYWLLNHMAEKAGVKS